MVGSYVRGLARVDRPPEQLALALATGSVLAKAIVADQDQPPFARSTRDGFACRAQEASSHADLQIAGATRAGQALPGPLPPGAAWEIMTGAPVPEGADAVVMIEHVVRKRDQVQLAASRTIQTGENIVARAAQAHAGDALIPVGTLLGAAQIALAAACGYAQIEVYTRPRVAILTTGDELVPVDQGRLQDKSATRMRPCSPRWWLPQGGSRGCCLPQRTRQWPSTPRSQRRSGPICCSSPAAFPQASLI